MLIKTESVFAFTRQKWSSTVPPSVHICWYEYQIYAIFLIYLLHTLATQPTFLLVFRVHKPIKILGNPLFLVQVRIRNKVMPWDFFVVLLTLDSDGFTLILKILFEKCSFRRWLGNLSENELLNCTGTQRYLQEWILRFLVRQARPAANSRTPVC